MTEFSFEGDPATKLMRVTMRGFWDAETVARFDKAARQFGAEMVAAGCPTSEMLVLVDAREVGAQAQHTLAEYKERFDSPERHTRKHATLVSSVLFKRQVERVAMPNQRTFEDEREALDWLLS